MIYEFAFVCAAAGAGLSAADGRWGWCIFLSLLAIGNLALLISEDR